MRGNPDHGTPARYRGNSRIKGCRCSDCRRAAVREEALCTLERLAGNPRRVPTAPVWDHVQKLRAAGVLDADIARAADLSSQSSLTRLAEQKMVGRDRARKILAIPLSYRPVKDFVPALGASRRVQALFAMGHSGATIADHAGTDRQRAIRLAYQRQDTLRADLDQAIRRTYTELASVQGVSSKARNLARRNGWHGPAAWDDIDDPAEQPGKVLALTSREAAQELLEEVLLLADAGALPEQIADRVDRSLSHVQNLLRKHRPAYYRHISLIAESHRGGNHKKRSAA